MRTITRYALLFLSLPLFNLSGADAFYAWQTEQLQALPPQQATSTAKKLTQKTLHDFFKSVPSSKKRKNSSSNFSASEDDADDEYETEDTSDDSMAAKAPRQTHILPPVTQPRIPLLHKPQPLHALSALELELGGAVMAACKPKETNPDHFRGKIYDLLNADRYQVNPDPISIVFHDSSRKKWNSSLLEFALLFCKNVSIVRLIAEKSSDKMKLQALSCKSILEKIKADPTLRNPFFKDFLPAE